MRNYNNYLFYLFFHRFKLAASGYPTTSGLPEIAPGTNYIFNPVSVTPFTSLCCAKAKMIIIGTIAIEAPVTIMSYLITC